MRASVRDDRFIDLSWTADLSTEITGYRISAGSARGREDLGVFTAGVTTRFTIGDLRAGSYHLRVQAINAAGTGPSSNEAFVTLEGDGSALNAPRFLRAMVSRLSVALSWRPPADGGRVDGYVIEVGSQPGASDLGSFESQRLSFAIQRLLRGPSYFRVRAVRGNVVGSASNEVMAPSESARCRASPAPPTVIRGEANGTFIELSWAAGSGERPTSYILEIGSQPGRRDLRAVDLGADTTSYTVPARRGRYFFRVTAVNECGSSNPSREVSVTPGGGLPVLPGAPVGITRKTSPTTVALTWWPPVTGDAPDYYIVEVTDGDGKPLATLETGSDAKFLYYTLPGVIHIIRVRAVNAAGIGPAAPPSTIVMPR